MNVLELSFSLYCKSFLCLPYLPCLAHLVLFSLGVGLWLFLSRRCCVLARLKRGRAKDGNGRCCKSWGWEDGINRCPSAQLTGKANRSFYQACSVHASEDQGIPCNSPYLGPSLSSLRLGSTRRALAQEASLGLAIAKTSKFHLAVRDRPNRLACRQLSLAALATCPQLFSRCRSCRVIFQSNCGPVLIRRCCEIYIWSLHIGWELMKLESRIPEAD